MRVRPPLLGGLALSLVLLWQGLPCAAPHLEAPRAIPLNEERVPTLCLLGEIPCLTVLSVLQRDAVSQS